MDAMKINATLRVNDSDANQYTIERLHTVLEGKEAGAVKWVVLAYCGNVKSIPTILKRTIVADAVAEARQKAEFEFFESGITQKVLALPEKDGTG